MRPHQIQQGAEDPRQSSLVYHERQLVEQPDRLPHPGRRQTTTPLGHAEAIGDLDEPKCWDGSAFSTD